MKKVRSKHIIKIKKILLTQETPIVLLGGFQILFIFIRMLLYAAKSFLNEFYFRKMFAKRPTIGECDEDLFLEQNKMYEEGKIKLNESLANKIKSENKKMLEGKKETKLKAVQEYIKSVSKKKKLSLYALKKLQEKGEKIDNERHSNEMRGNLVTGEGLIIGKSQNEKKKAEKDIENIRHENTVEMNKMSEKEILEKQAELLSNPG